MMEGGIFAYWHWDYGYFDAGLGWTADRIYVLDRTRHLGTERVLGIHG